MRQLFDQGRILIAHCPVVNCPTRWNIDHLSQHPNSRETGYSNVLIAQWHHKMRSLWLRRRSRFTSKLGLRYTKRLRLRIGDLEFWCFFPFLCFLPIPIFLVMRKNVSDKTLPLLLSVFYIFQIIWAIWKYLRHERNTSDMREILETCEKFLRHDRNTWDMREKYFIHERVIL